MMGADFQSKAARSIAEMRSAALAARPYLLPVAAITALLVFFHRGTLRWLANAWTTNDYYTHGMLVPFVTLFFVWRARHKIAAIAATSPRAQDLWLLGGSALLYLYGIQSGDALVLSFSLLLSIAGAALYLMGAPRARYVMLPLSLLVLAIPLPNLLEVGVRMQVIATAGTTMLLGWFGVPVVQDNFMIHAGSLSFEVVPLCSGLSSMISILTLTSIVAALTPIRPAAKVLLVLASAPIAIVANILRIAAVIGVGLRWGPEASEGFFHGSSSLVLFLIALGCVLALSSLLIRIPKVGVRSD